MRVAAIYDIHGNLPALEAVLLDIRELKVDRLNPQAQEFAANYLLRPPSEGEMLEKFTHVKSR
jgi:hypothetical protein